MSQIHASGERDKRVYDDQPGPRGQKTGNTSRPGGRTGTHTAGPGQPNKGGSPRVLGRMEMVVRVSDEQRLGTDSSWGIRKLASRFTQLPTEEETALQVLSVDRS